MANLGGELENIGILTVMMGIIIGFVLGIPAGLIANYFSPPFSKWVTGLLGSLAQRWDPDRHDLTGTWRAISEEPDSPDTNNRVPVHERIEIKHVGAFIDCKSKVVDDDPREFRYQLRVSHSMVYGTYKKKADRNGVQLGSGMIQMIVDPNRTKMTGSVTWYDSDTGEIEHSKVEWKLQ